ncbi:MAG: hydroxyacylglutathione hydrolase C-terminal domain-containing protein [bacterium]
MIVPLKSTISDNWFYLLHDAGEGVLIDPIDPAVACEAVDALGLALTLVINTHWHPDHVAGDDAVLAAYPDAKLWVARGDADKIASLIASTPDALLSAGDTVPVGAQRWDVLDIPGHTLGHIGLRYGDEFVVGDTVFAAGAGHCRSGDPQVLFRTYRDVFTGLDGKIRMYPGHDYAVRNLEFSASILASQAVQDAAEQAKHRSEYVPLSLRQERLTNPFMRAFEPDYQAIVRDHAPDAWRSWEERGTSGAECAFCVLRELRNAW